MRKNDSQPIRIKADWITEARSKTTLNPVAKPSNVDLLRPLPLDNPILSTAEQSIECALDHYRDLFVQRHRDKMDRLESNSSLRRMQTLGPSMKRL